MKRFIERHQERVVGVLEGFDRLVIRGSLRALAFSAGMASFLKHRRVDLADFDRFVSTVSRRVIEASCQEARRLDRPVIYLSSSRVRNQDKALEIAERDGVTSGIVCILRVVEPCISFQVARFPTLGGREVRVRQRKCQHLYHYFVHPRFGLMHVRLQTWFPFDLQIWINGREWLSRQLDRARIPYERAVNCFPYIADYARAQRLMRRQLDLDWPKQLQPIVRQVNPLHLQVFRGFPADYYWTVHQSEWATDIVFKEPAALARIYPQLLHHGITALSSADIMRFLGGKVSGNFRGQIVSDFKDRPDGFRLRHAVGRNSVKLYDKQGIILRTETTIDDPTPIKVFRPLQGDPEGPKDWRPMRKSVADLRRRIEVSQAANHRYLDALAAADTTTPLGLILETVSRPIRPRQGRRVRGLRPWDAADLALLRAVAKGAVSPHGFVNNDVRLQIFSRPGTKRARRRQSAKVSRLLSVLRAHGLIRKLGRTRRYVLTTKGHLVSSAVIAAADVTLKQLSVAA